MMTTVSLQMGWKWSNEERTHSGQFSSMLKATDIDLLLEKLVDGVPGKRFDVKLSVALICQI